MLRIRADVLEKEADAAKDSLHELRYKGYLLENEITAIKDRSSLEDIMLVTKGLYIKNDKGETIFYAGAGVSGDGLLEINNKSGQQLIHAGADVNGNGLLKVNNKSGQKLIYAGAAVSGNGAFVQLYNKTGEGIIQLSTDDYGNGVVGAFNRKGKGRTLESK